MAKTVERIHAAREDRNLMLLLLEFVEPKFNHLSSSEPAP